MQTTINDRLGETLALALRAYQHRADERHGNLRDLLEGTTQVITALFDGDTDEVFYLPAPTFYSAEFDGVEADGYQFSLTTRSTRDWLLSLDGRHGLRAESVGRQGGGFYFVMIRVA